MKKVLITIGSAVVFIASFLLAIGVTLLLLPKKFAKGQLEGVLLYIHY